MSLFDVDLCGKQHKNIRVLKVENTSVLGVLKFFEKTFIGGYLSQTDNTCQEARS